MENQVWFTLKKNNFSTVAANSNTLVRGRKNLGLNRVELLLRRIIQTWMGQIIRFGFVGVLNTFVDGSAYFLLSRSGLIPDLVIAKGISYSVGVLNSFIWNRSWTFKSHVDSRRVFIPFIVTNLLAVGINAWVMRLALNVFGLPELGALALATAAIFIWNFAINKFFIFK
jgi:putative flippase GtrA